MYWLRLASLFAIFVIAFLAGRSIPVTAQGIAPPGLASPVPGIAPNSPAEPAQPAEGPDLDTTIDYIEKNAPAELSQSWIEAYDAGGDRQQVKFTLGFAFSRTDKCSLDITRRNNLDTMDTDASATQPANWYFPSGLHLEDATTDYHETRDPTTNNQINGARHTVYSVQTSVVLHLDRLYVGDLKLYPTVPGKLPLKAVFAFSNSEAAIRVLRAIDHAAALCGASADPFAH